MRWLRLCALRVAGFLAKGQRDRDFAAELALSRVAGRLRRHLVFRGPPYARDWRAGRARAGAADVLRMVMRQGLALIATGASIGLASAWAMTPLISEQLYGVRPNDPATLLVAVLLILLVGGMACWTPARRAMRVDPMAALRYELNSVAHSEGERS
jgi:hypothetical protein